MKIFMQFISGSVLTENRGIASITFQPVSAGFTLLFLFDGRIYSFAAFFPHFKTSGDNIFHEIRLFVKIFAKAREERKTYVGIKRIDMNYEIRWIRK